MDLLKKTEDICRNFNIKPARSKGQNFLIKESVYDKIVEVAELASDDWVLEVGPGLGFLTVKLADKAEHVVAVELDDKLAEILQVNKELKQKKVEIVNQSVLDFYDHPILRRQYKIVANLPYNITSVFLRYFLSGNYQPERLVLMLQKEVAERMVAKPGDMSILAVSVQFYGDPEIMFDVPARDFWPEPRVDSAVIRIKVRQKPDINEKDFFRIVKFGFSAKRKMLKNNLSSGMHISSEEAEKMIVAVGLNPKIRAEELSVGDWEKLYKLSIAK